MENNHKQPNLVNEKAETAQKGAVAQTNEDLLQEKLTAGQAKPVASVQREEIQ